MSYPGAKQIAISIDERGVGSPPANTEIGAEYTAIEFSAATAKFDPTLVIESIKLFSDKDKKEDVTSQYFQRQLYFGGYNRVCLFVPDLKIPETVTLWYEVFYKDKGIEHSTDPTVTIDPRGG